MKSNNIVLDCTTILLDKWPAWTRSTRSIHSLVVRHFSTYVFTQCGQHNNPSCIKSTYLFKLYFLIAEYLQWLQESQSQRVTNIERPGKIWIHKTPIASGFSKILYYIFMPNTPVKNVEHMLTCEDTSWWKIYPCETQMNTIHGE